MSNVKTFVEGKQHLKLIDPQRQAVGNQHRVSVPLTRLNRAGTNLVGRKPKVPPFHVGPSTLQRGFIRGREPTGFDTDAESLEDTTIMDVSANGNGHPQVAQFLVPSKRISNDAHAESQNVHDSFRGQEELNRPEHESNASEYDEEGSSESGGDGYQDPYSVIRLLNDFGSEEFANFKRHNILDKDLLQELHTSPERATKRRTVASSDAPTRARSLAGPSSSKSPSPTRHHATHAVDPKFRYNDVWHVEDPTKTANSRRIGDMDQASSWLLGNQHRVTPGGVGSTRQLPNRASYPSLQITRAETDPAYTIAKSQPVIERLSREKTTHRQVSSVFDNDSVPILDLSEDENMDKKAAESESGQGILNQSQSLDHSTLQLATMTFQQLRDECFDDGFAPAITVLSPEFAEASLHAKLEYLFSMRDSMGRDVQQQAFFDGLTIEHYGESGEILGQKMSELIAKLSSIRKKKRDIAGEFELEVAKREQIVRIKAAVLKKEKVVMTRQTEELTARRPP